MRLDRKFKDFSLAAKFSLVMLPAVGILLIGLAMVQSHLAARSLEQKSEAQLRLNNQLAVGMIDSYNMTVRERSSGCCSSG
ncbi:MAG: hypothetical protein FJY37_08915 [Betaproteobacteria bacterium]|nr:hypothetical protein [Betaproteobacteria bacterium]